MSGMPQTKEFVTDDLCFLAFMQRMAQTAQSPAAKHVYDLFLKQEKKRFEANGGSEFPGDGGTGGRRIRGGSLNN